MAPKVRFDKKRGRPSKYPWDAWLKQDEPFTLRRGKDYVCATATFMQSIRSRATKDGLKVSISLIDDNTIRVTVKRY